MAKKNLSEVVIDALEDIKARDIIVLNVSKLTSMFDHIAIASGDSNRQTKALANNVITKVKEAGFHIVGSEGEGSGEWVLVDCGDIVVHIMQPAVREYYKLEELWMDGKIEWPKPKREVKSRIVSAGEEEAVPAKKVAAKKVPAKKPAAKKPAAKKPAAKKPVAKKSAAKKPAAKKPTAKKPIAKKPAAKKPAAKKPVAKKPAVKTAVAKKPAAKKPATKKTA
jgi:ribosome-associated protein